MTHHCSEDTFTTSYFTTEQHSSLLVVSTKIGSKVLKNKARETILTVRTKNGYCSFHWYHSSLPVFERYIFLLLVNAR